MRSDVVTTIGLERVTTSDIRAVHEETSAAVGASRIRCMTKACAIAPWLDVEEHLTAWVVVITVEIFQWSGVCHHEACGLRLFRLLEALATRQTLILMDIWWTRAI